MFPILHIYPSFLFLLSALAVCIIVILLSHFIYVSVSILLFFFLNHFQLKSVTQWWWFPPFSFPSAFYFLPLATQSSKMLMVLGFVLQLIFSLCFGTFSLLDSPACYFTVWFCLLVNTWLSLFFELFSINISFPRILSPSFFSIVMWVALDMLR